MLTVGGQLTAVEGSVVDVATQLRCLRCKIWASVTPLLANFGLASCMQELGASSLVEGLSRDDEGLAASSQLRQRASQGDV